MSAAAVPKDKTVAASCAYINRLRRLRRQAAAFNADDAAQQR